MPIKIIENTTKINCEICNYEVITEKNDGVVPSDWMTGQLWLDKSLSEQHQRPLSFCPTCKVYLPHNLTFGLL